jgi:hypothetical protein
MKARHSMGKLLRIRISTLLLLTLCAAAAAAQSAPFPVTLEKELAGRATDFTEVTLDKNMLSFASKFLDGKDADEAKVRTLIEKLDGIYVRTYTFDKDGQYSADDLASLRHQIAGPEWSSIVRQRSKTGSGDVDVYVKLVGGDVRGMFVLDAESKELTFVYISGPIRVEDLTELGGNFGIPKVDDHGKGSDGKADTK